MGTVFKSCVRRSQPVTSSHLRSLTTLRLAADGDKYKQKREFRAFGCKNLRELIDKCEKLKPRMKNDKMYIRSATGIPGSAALKVEKKDGAEAEGQQMSVREAKRAAKRARDGDDAAAAPRREKKAKKGVS